MSASIASSPRWNLELVSRFPVSRGKDTEPISFETNFESWPTSLPVSTISLYWMLLKRLISSLVRDVERDLLMLNLKVFSLKRWIAGTKQAYLISSLSTDSESRLWPGASILRDLPRSGFWSACRLVNSLGWSLETASLSAVDSFLLSESDNCLLSKSGPTVSRLTLPGVVESNDCFVAKACRFPEDPSGGIKLGNGLRLPSGEGKGFTESNSFSSFFLVFFFSAFPSNCFATCLALDLF